MEKHPIYNFLKENNLTDLDEKTFLDKYSDPERAKEIHAFLKQNDLTDLDDNQFYQKYFSSSLTPTIAKTNATVKSPITEFEQQQAVKIPEPVKKKEVPQFAKPSQDGLEMSGDGSKPSQDQGFDFIKEQIDLITPKLVGKTEEQVVPEMNYRFAPLGFKFEEDYIGNYMTVTAPNGNKRLISLSNFTQKGDTEEAAKLKSFIQENIPDANLVAKAQRNYRDENMKIKSREDIDGLYDNVRKLSESMMSDVEELSRAKSLIEKEASYLSSVPENQRNSPEYISRVENFNIGVEEYNKRYSDLISKKNSASKEAKSIDKAVAKYMAMKEESGGFLTSLAGAALVQFPFNTLIGYTDVIVDVISYISPETMLGPKEYESQFINVASSLGIKKPEGISFNDFASSISKEDLSKINSKLNDIGRKMSKEEMIGMLSSTRDKLMEAIGTDPEYYSKSKENLILGGVVGAIESLPAMVTGFGSIPLMGIQSIGAVSEEMATNPEFENISENEKLLVKVPIAIANGVLEKMGFSNLIKNQPFVANLVQRALGKLGNKFSSKSFAEFVKEDIDNMIARGALTLAGGFVSEFETGASQELVESGIKNIYNLVKDKEMFDVPDSVLEYVSDAFIAGVQEGIGAGVLGGPTAVSAALGSRGYLDISDGDFLMFELSVADPMIAKSHESKLASKVASGEITKAEMDKQMSNYNESVSIYSAIPQDISIKDKKIAMNLVREKRSLERSIEGKDPALVKPQKERINQINARLEKISIDAESNKTGRAKVEEEGDTFTAGDQVSLEVDGKPKTEAEKPEAPTYTVSGSTMDKRRFDAAVNDAKKIEELDELDTNDPAMIKSINEKRREILGMDKNDPAILPGDLGIVAGVKVRYPSEVEADERKKSRTDAKYVIDSASGLQVEDVDTLTKDLEGEFAILSGENPMGMPLSEEENSSLTEAAIKWLTDKGYSPRRVTGKYGTAENSMIVPGMTAEDAMAFAKEFNQDSVAHSTGLLYQDGRVAPRKKDDDNFSFNEFKPTDDYITVVNTPDGLRSFGIGYDFDNMVQPKTEQKDAIQKQEAGGVPVQPEARVSEEVEGGKPEAEPKETTGKKEVKDEKDGSKKPLLEESRDGRDEGKEREKGSELRAEKEEKVDRAKEVEAASNIDDAIANAMKTLGMIIPDADIVVADTIEEAVAKAREILQGRLSPFSISMIINDLKKSSGMVTFIGGKPVIAFIVKDRANASTAAHETWHVILREAFGKNTAKFKQFKESIDKQLRESGYEDLADDLQAFSDMYSGDVSYEEYIVELGGRMASYGFDASKLSKKEASLLEKIKEIINKFSKELIGKEVFLEDATPENILSFMTAISDKIARGEDVRGLIKRSDAEGGQRLGVESLMQADFSDRDSKLTFIYDKNSDRFDKLKRDGFINENVPLSNFNGKNILLHQPDAAFSGEIQKDGQTLVEGKGGLFYTAKFHDDKYLWASTKGAASILEKSLNEVSEQNGGKILLGLTSAPYEKLLSSTTMANAVVDFFSSKAFDSSFKLDRNTLKNSLVKASKHKIVESGREVGLKLRVTQKESISEIKSKISNKLSSDKSSFRDRKVFVEELIGQMAEAINQSDVSIDQFGKLFSEGIQNKYFKGVTKTGKLRISKKNMIQALSEMFTEPMLKEGFTDRSKGGQIYAILEVDGKVKSVKSEKHESYPVAIQAENPVKIHILKDRPQWNDVFKKQDGSSISKSEEKRIYPSTGLSTQAIKLDFVGVETSSQLPKKVSDKLTEDGEGNYLFHHYSGERRNVIKRSDGSGSTYTSREEQRSLSAVGGLAMYYPQSGQKESMVGNVQHTIAVPVNRVYDADSDPLNFKDEARERFEKVRPGQAFDANYRVAFITQVAGENGFDMVISEWVNGELRAQTTKELTPLAENKPLKERAPKEFAVGDWVKYMSGRYQITEIDGDIAKMEGYDMYGDRQRNVANLKREARRIQKIEEDIETLSQKPLPSRVNERINDVIEEQKSLGKKPVDVAREAVRILKQEDAFKKLGDRDKKKVIDGVKRLSGMRVKVTVDEYAALKDQIKLEARAARETNFSSKAAIKSLASSVRALVSQGKISTYRAAVIIGRISRTNFFDQGSVDATISYIADVFDNANLAVKISRAKSLVKSAKNNLRRKLGQNMDLYTAAKSLTSIDPHLVPTPMIDDYLDIMEVLGERARSLSVSDVGDMVAKINVILNSIKQKPATTTTVSVKETPQESINAAEALISDMLANPVDISKITDENDSAVARAIASITEEDMRAMLKERADGTVDRSALKNLQAVRSNIQAGLVTHEAMLISEAVQKARRVKEMSRVVKSLNGTKILSGISRGIGKIKGIITGKSGILEAIRSLPLEFIDDTIGNYNDKTIRNTLFGRLASQKGKLDGRIADISAKADAAERLFREKRSDNTAVKAKYKVMAYLIQQEHDSNPGNPGVAPAIDFIKETIKAIERGETSLSNYDAKILREIMDEFSTVGANGNVNIDADSLLDSMSPNDIKAMELVKDINSSTSNEALFTSGVVRGNRVNIVSNYVHHAVISTDAATEAKALIDKLLNRTPSGSASTKAGTLNERTPGAKAIAFDPVYAAVRGAKMTLTDYYMTSEIRTAMGAVRELRDSIMDDPSATKEQKNVAKALYDAFDEAVQIAFQSHFYQDSTVEAFIKKAQKLGYYTALASIPRAGAEFLSNMSFAVLSDPATTVSATKFAGEAYSTDFLGFLTKIGSAETIRLAGTDMLSGKYSEGSTLAGYLSRGKSRAKSKVMNYMSFISRVSASKVQDVSSAVSEALISTPDKAISRPYYIASFVKHFKNASGIELSPSDIKDIANGTSQYLAPAYEKMIESARVKADQESIRLAGSNNSFSTILKNAPRSTDSSFMAAYRAANSFMSRFYLTEYSTVRSAVIALFKSGEISKGQAAGILAASATRMSSYLVLYSMMSAAFDSMIKEMFGFEDEEEDDEDILDKTIRSVTGQAVQMMSRRTLGNIGYVPIAMMVENINKTYGEEFGLREGEYDNFKDALVYSQVSERDLQTKSPYEVVGKLMLGPMAPVAASISRVMVEGGKQMKNDSEKSIIQATIDGMDERTALEAAGNLGLIPFYKDIRRIMMAHMYSKKQIEKNKHYLYSKEFIELMERVDPEQAKEMRKKEKEMKEIFDGSFEIQSKSKGKTDKQLDELIKKYSK